MSDIIKEHIEHLKKQRRTAQAQIELDEKRYAENRQELENLNILIAKLEAPE